MVLMTPLASATLLVGFHNFSETKTNDFPDPADIQVGFTGSVVKNTNSVNLNGSNDATWGNDAVTTPVPSINDGYLVDGNTLGNVYNAVRVDYNGDANWTLQSLLFDAASLGSGKTGYLSYKVLTGVNEGTTVDLGTVALRQITAGNLGSTVSSGYFGNYIVSLLSFNIVMNFDGSGDSTIEFRFNVGDGTTPGYIDNVALIANLTPVPETGSLAALGCLVGSGAFLRSRRRGARMA